MKKNAAKYPGSQAALYLIVNVVCQLASKQLKAFADFKKKYTQEFIDAILASLKAAEALPNRDSRQGKQSIRRTTLENVNVSICNLFQMLLLYIEDGFEASQWADMRLMAGAGYYEAARKNGWAASKTMQEMAMEFMATYAADLAKGDMPDDFAANFAVQNEAFLAALLDFSTGKNIKSEGTTDKLTANNDLYVRIQALMRDGRRIFSGNETMMSQFSYDVQLRLVSGQGDTGFRFKLQEAETLVPIQTASVRFLPSGDVFDEVNEEGILLAHLPELKEGSYSYMLQCPGYEEVKGELAADTGVMHRVNLVLKPMAMSVTERKSEKIG